MRGLHAALGAGLAFGLLSGTAQASYIINIEQHGSDVVATGSGSIDTSGFGFVGTGNEDPFVAASLHAIKLGVSSDEDAYTATISGPASFGSGEEFDADSGTGLPVGFAFSNDELVLPSGYVSGDFIASSTATFSNATFASLGLTPGTYVYTLSPEVLAETFRVRSLAVSNTVTLNIGGSVSVGTVPLPASAPMFGAALLALGAVGYGMKRKAV